MPWITATLVGIITLESISVLLRLQGLVTRRLPWAAPVHDHATATVLQESALTDTGEPPHLLRLLVDRRTPVNCGRPCVRI